MLIECPSIPTGLPEVTPEAKGVVLAHGEVTGHAHAIAPDEARQYRAPGQGTVSYLEVKAALAMLRHDEHATVELPRGTYEVRRQREYSPAAIRNVAD